MGVEREQRPGEKHKVSLIAGTRLCLHLGETSARTWRSLSPHPRRRNAPAPLQVALRSSPVLWAMGGHTETPRGLFGESERAVAALLGKPPSPGLQPGLQAQASRPPRTNLARCVPWELSKTPCCLHARPVHCRPRQGLPQGTQRWGGSILGGTGGVNQGGGCKAGARPPALVDTSSVQPGGTRVGASTTLFAAGMNSSSEGVHPGEALRALVGAGCGSQALTHPERWCRRDWLLSGEDPARAGGAGDSAGADGGAQPGSLSILCVMETSLHPASIATWLPSSLQHYSVQVARAHHG